MYADDMVINVCAESANKLQNMFNTLTYYCIDQDLEVNVEKTLLPLEMLEKHVMRNRGHN